MLNPTAEGIVKQMLGSKTMPDIASVADIYRTYAQGKWSSPCHFADLPHNVKGFEMKYCPGYCVVKSIQNYTKILQKEAAKPAACNMNKGEEPCALVFLIHFIGDVHQPLHVGYEDDKGGNDVDVTWFGSSKNLHSVWDSAILSKWNPDWNSASNALETIMSDDPSIVTKYMAQMDPIHWGTESYDLVKSVVYDFNPALGAAPRADPALGQAYYDATYPVVQQRLIAGGVRLGHLLNTILKK